MSRAFVKESDGDDAGDLPELPVSEHPNYVTPRGLSLLRAHGWTRPGAGSPRSTRPPRARRWSARTPNANSAGCSPG